MTTEPPINKAATPNLNHALQQTAAGRRHCNRRERPCNFTVQFNMKQTLSVTRLAFLVFIVGILAAASVNADDKTNFITTREIAAMTPRTATFAKRLSGYAGWFTNAAGKSFILGDERGEQWVWHFVCALKEGQNYRFPDTFTNYLAAPS